MKHKKYARRVANAMISVIVAVILSFSSTNFESFIAMMITMFVLTAVDWMYLNGGES